MTPVTQTFLKSFLHIYLLPSGVAGSSIIAANEPKVKALIPMRATIHRVWRSPYLFLALAALMDQPQGI